MREAGGGIPVVDQDGRRAILALPPTVSAHRRLYAEMPFATAVEVVNVPSAVAQASEVRVMAWNAARCTNVDAFARFIQASRADVVLLTEMDRGMARSGQLHTARELASRLSMGYAYAVEFLELGSGDEHEKAAHPGAANEVGYHGAAILSARPLSRARRVLLEESGGWFDGMRGQRRVGGRMALCADVGTGAGAEAVFCAVHVESESDPSERAREMRVLFEELDRTWPGRPVVIGGDLNTFSVSRTELDDPSSLRRREAEDPGRLGDPVAHEPLFELARRHGYDWRQSNVPGAATHGRMKIDWFLTRGMTAHTPGVLPAVDVGSRSVLSDHDAIILTVNAGTRPSLTSGSRG